MKIRFQILVLMTIGLLSCTPKENGTLNIVAKYKVLDELMSPGHISCDGDVKLFQEMDFNDCSFKVDNDEFDIIEKFELDDKGNLKEYWTYKAEGPLTYTLQDLDNDSKQMDLKNLKGVNVRLLGTIKILDTGDTLEIERITDNLIFVKQNREMSDKNVRHIYEFKK